LQQQSTTPVDRSGLQSLNTAHWFIMRNLAPSQCAATIPR